jgi:tRNA threonylcarbamoyladenosine biosynthesis protein TsaE
LSGAQPPAPPLRLQAAPLPGEAATEALGAGLARALPPDPAGPLVLALEGELGAGKTTLARALLRALGAQGAIKSPSYALLEPYDLPPWQVLHLDLYRLVDPGELEQLGVRDALLPGSLLLVEWPGRGAGHLPPADLWLQLSEPAGAATVSGKAAPEARQVTIEAGTPAGRAWLAALLAGGGATWQDSRKAMDPTL